MKLKVVPNIYMPYTNINTKFLPSTIYTKPKSTLDLILTPNWYESFFNIHNINTYPI